MGDTKKALITGITGQDGSFLAEHLWSLGYEIHGLVRPASTSSDERLKGCIAHIKLHTGDLTDSLRVQRILCDVQPHEIYNLAAQSHIGTSYDSPFWTTSVTANGCIPLLLYVKDNPKTRYFQASTADIFGPSSGPQDESTPIHPRSPYGCAKAYAHMLTQNFRESHTLYAVNGIMFGHESHRRSPDFLSRKVTLGVANIYRGNQSSLALGNLEAMRDWGHAMDYVRAMHLMLQGDTPEDYVLSTGHVHTVRDFVRLAFEHVNLDYEKYVVIDPKFYRPIDAPKIGNSTKAQAKLGWKPTITLEGLVNHMMMCDLTKVEER
jgi:GDPmannose 4,6-dehydratase